VALLPAVLKWDQYLDGSETSGFSRRNVLNGFGLFRKYVALCMVLGNGRERVHRWLRNTDNPKHIAYFRATNKTKLLFTIYLHKTYITYSYCIEDVV